MHDDRDDSADDLLAELGRVARDESDPPANWEAAAAGELDAEGHLALRGTHADDPALHQALASDAFYIGVLGSTRTHAKRVARLEEQGFDASDIARIHAPVGLNIGAKTPAEIAISVMAEITQTLRAR